MDNYDNYEEAIKECNELDLALYQYALDELWPAQVKEYGEEKLITDLGLDLGNPEILLNEMIKYKTNRVFRLFVYKPLSWSLEKCEVPLVKTRNRWRLGRR